VPIWAADARQEAGTSFKMSWVFEGSGPQSQTLIASLGCTAAALSVFTQGRSMIA
jgi:hypothetical protein